MTDEHRLTTHSPADTHAVGARIGASLCGRACIALDGPLGAGKTQLTKGIAKGCGVGPDVTVNSPTFVIVNEYAGRVRIFHIDAYRLSGCEELDAIGFDEMLESDSVVIVEWSDRVASIIPDDHLAIRMEHAGDTIRDIRIRATGERSRRILGALSGLS